MIFALTALAASGAVSADERFARPGESARTAALYVELPLRADRRRTKPVFGLRLEALPLGRPAFPAARHGGGASTLLDVPLRAREADPLGDAGAAMLLGKGAIVGIVVGAIVAASVIADDDDDGGGGGY